VAQQSFVLSHWLASEVANISKTSSPRDFFNVKGRNFTFLLFDHVEGRKENEKKNEEK